jgi:hypothetical protein
MYAMDTTNLSVTFTVPRSGMVAFRCDGRVLELWDGILWVRDWDWVEA